MSTMRAVSCIAGIVAATFGVTAGAQSAWQYSGVDRVVAVSDIHGAHDAFVQILERAAVIDGQAAWVGGATHLVIVGDVLDRGADSRRSLDLIMRLETEAPAAGGRVHLLLGNHEVMNMTGDLRYVAPGEYQAFAADEEPADRDQAYERYVASLNGADTRPDRKSFDEQFPPGFFAHRKAFAPDGVYGRWLLEKPFLLTEVW